MEKLILTHIDAFGVPHPVEFDERESAWLRFLRWLRESGHLSEELPGQSIELDLVAHGVPRSTFGA